MAISSAVYTHDLDRSALKALQAIPGFTQLLKAFMKIWSEKQFHILNMSTNLRIDENQMPKYYNMLPPICEKLGIDVPDLYLELDVVPNAYTSGDTKPFIVITTGLLETMPEELIPTVLAHECGHIACHHVLYSTMGKMILNGAISLLGLNELVSFPIQTAFYYWMRCSEYSADRAAVLCDGNADKVIEMCMRFAGFDKDVNSEGNMGAFMQQAAEYKEMVKESAWNKALEFIMFNNRTHPLNAVRAYEANEWRHSDTFRRVVSYMNGSDTSQIPIPKSSKQYIGMHYREVAEELKEAGFCNIFLAEQRVRKTRRVTEEAVNWISIDGVCDFEQGSWFRQGAVIRISYQTFFESYLYGPGGEIYAPSYPASGWPPEPPKG